MLKELSSDPVLPDLHMQPSYMQQRILEGRQKRNLRTPISELQAPILPDGHVINIQPINEDTDMLKDTEPQILKRELVMGTNDVNPIQEKVTSPTTEPLEPQKKKRKVKNKSGKTMKSEITPKLSIQSAHGHVLGAPIAQEDINKLLYALSKPGKSDTLPSAVVLNNKSYKVIAVNKLATSAGGDQPKGASVSLGKELKPVSLLKSMTDTGMQVSVKTEPKDDILGSQNEPSSPKCQKDSFVSNAGADLISQSAKCKTSDQSEKFNVSEYLANTGIGGLIYTCKICSTIYNNELELRSHLKLDHQKSQRCLLCGFTTESKVTIENHCIDKHPDVFLCPQEGCNYMSVRKVGSCKRTCSSFVLRNEAY